MSTMSGAGQSQPQAKTYDFTKRKRWADLLLTELVDNIPLILSVSGKILYCGNAVTELLGWRDVELLDVNFIQLVDPGDQPRFLFSFNQSLQTSTEFNILVRLKHSERLSSFDDPSLQKYILFDMKCYPHVTTVGSIVETRCFFGMAVPYPSRNTAMIDTILDLKVENYRLQCLVAESRARLARDGLIPKQNMPTTGSSIYATSSLQSNKLGPTRTTRGEPTGPYLSSSSGHGADVMTGGADFSALGYKSGSGHLGELTEEGSKKKKPKRTHSLEQYVCVTCGQTDSPEWRKGPAGPKTLCNACGLRWAKQMRKVDEPIDANAAMNDGA